METENGLGERYLFKFRAWDFEDSTLHQWGCMDDFPLKGKRGTFPQESTGFLDKNSNEIYVGDIIHFRGYNTIVRYISGSYVLWIMEPKSTLNFFRFYTVKDNTNEMEIVGNTFTHSEYITRHLVSKPETIQ